jgi:hypothetical protein
MHSTTDRTSAPAHDVFRMSEFDAVAARRSVGEVLQANLENAEAQLAVVERRAERARRRADDLGQAVRNWHELIADYERATGAPLDVSPN